MKYLFAWLILLSETLCSFDSYAQQSKFEVTAGTGYSFATAKQMSPQSRPALGLHLMTALRIPLERQIFIRTGIGYSRKSIRSLSPIIDDNLLSTWDVKSDYHFINVALIVGGVIKLYKNHQVEISGGMNYNFLMKCDRRIHIDRYNRAGEVYDSQELNYSPEIFLVAPNNRLNKNFQTGLLLFNPAVYLDAGYVISRHAKVKLFYEYHLTDVGANLTGTGTTRMHYSGLSVSWLF